MSPALKPALVLVLQEPLMQAGYVLQLFCEISFSAIRGEVWLLLQQCSHLPLFVFFSLRVNCIHSQIWVASKDMSSAIQLEWGLHFPSALSDPGFGGWNPTFCHFPILPNAVHFCCPIEFNVSHLKSNFYSLCCLLHDLLTWKHTH